jgi:acyl-CoA dehydrogenase
MRSVQMTGALEAVLELSVTYASDRRQFGSPLLRFQAIQEQLAILAAEVAATQAAVAVALDEPDWQRTAAAKIRAGGAAGHAVRIAHQVHGAIGFTDEHQLHHFTRRLLSWRDEYGTEHEWAARLGSALVPESYWEMSTNQ